MESDLKIRRILIKHGGICDPPTTFPPHLAAPRPAHGWT